MSVTTQQSRAHGRFSRKGAGIAEQKRYLVDGAMTGLIGFSAFVGVAILVIILFYVFFRGVPALNIEFFTQRPLPYGEVGGGVMPAIVGSLAMLLLAGFIGVPIGIGTAIYLSEFGDGHLGTIVRFVIDLIAGLPSIVVGVFVWALLVRQVIGQYNGLAGSVALAIIMIPIVCRTVEEMLRLVPHSYREASLALGVQRWKTICWVVLPTARSGIITGVVLSIARAGGETAPLLLTALGNQFFSLNFLAPMAALPVQIYNYAVAPYDDWHTKAWGSALVLILVIGFLSLLTRLVTRNTLANR